MTDTTTDRELLVAVRRWATAAGWVPYGLHGWTDPAGMSTAYRTGTAVDWDHRSITVYRRTNHWHWDRREYPVDSARQAVDVLVAVGVLPPHLSSAYQVAQAEREQADRDAQQAYADRAHLWRLARAARAFIVAEQGDRLDPWTSAPVLTALERMRAAVDAAPMPPCACDGCAGECCGAGRCPCSPAPAEPRDADQPDADDASPTTDDIEDLLTEVRAALASATTDDERAEVVAHLLSEWYGMWPDTAVTDPHAPLAGELLRLLAPYAAQVQQLTGPLAGYTMVTVDAPTLPDTAYPPGAAELAVDLPTITIERPDDEHIEIHVNGVAVASANYDEHGWSGMDAVERTALAVSRALSPEGGESR